MTSVAVALIVCGIIIVVPAGLAVLDNLGGLEPLHDPGGLALLHDLAGFMHASWWCQMGAMMSLTGLLLQALARIEDALRDRQE